MKKFLFLLVALLGVVGMANAQTEDFTLGTPDYLPLNTLSIANYDGVKTQEFTVNYQGGTITYVGAAPTVVDQYNNELATALTVNNVSTVEKPNTFTVTINDASAITAAGDNYFIAFPAGAFSVGATTSKKFGVHLDVAKTVTMDKWTLVKPENGTKADATRTWTIPNLYVRPNAVDADLSVSSGVTVDVLNANAVSGLTINGTHISYNVTGLTTSPSTFTIPANTYKFTYSNHSVSYNDAVTFTVNLIDQKVFVNVTDANATTPVCNETSKLRLEFFTDAALINYLKNIDSSDLLDFTITGKDRYGKDVNFTYNDFKYSSTNNDHKTFVTNTSTIMPGTYTVCMHFNTDNLVISGLNKAEYEYVYGTLVVNQHWTGSALFSVDKKALDGEDITKDIENLKINFDNVYLAAKDTYTHPCSTKPATALPFVSNAYGITVDVDKLVQTENYKLTLTDLLDAGKGYIITFPANSLCYVNDKGTIVYNNKTLSVNLDIFHAFNFVDVDANQTATATVDSKADTYERLHYTREYNGNLQAAYLPFDLVITDVVAADVDFYQINAAYLDEAGVPHLMKTHMPVGKTVKAYLPYLVQAKKAGEVKYTFAGQLKAAPTTPGSVVTSTAFATYTFTGTTTGNLDGLLPDLTNITYMLVGNQGGINDLNADQRKAYNQEYSGAQASKNKTISAWRFYVTRDDDTGYDQYVDYSKLIIDEDETTGIDAVESNVENGVMFNVAGQRISAPVKGQVYILNGKKYIAK